ncbi:MAG TPA: hypothetical protein VGO63_04210 [Candidatus Paceibacterota bacterium]|jgi:hypothetical protein|nr:hypothetical protein [Candidatus Paceibacterota bacterium]
MAKESENKICQNCKNDFIIEADDFGFYEKINVSPPTFCPQCRLQRRLAWRNDLALYNRSCDKCGKKIVSLYHPNKPLTVYCNTCWWGDGWDPKSYAKDVDFSRPFFEQFRELQDKVPLLALINDDGIGSVNSEYTQNVTFSKNCYMEFMSWYVEDCMYSYCMAGPETREVMDSLSIFYYSQIIYECVSVEHCYNCRNCYFSTGLTDCILCYDCKGCSNTFMCANLRQKKYCILNKQYSKEEYEKMIKSYRLDTYSGMEKAKKEFAEFLSKQPRKFANIVNSVDSTGNGLVDCKNTKDSFMARGCEDMRFLVRGDGVKDSYDLTPGGKSSQSYEGLTADHDYRAFFSIFSLKNQEVSYVENCHSSKHLFGCSGIRHGEYLIFNKQYIKEEYFELRDKLIEHMKTTEEYGEFFPSAMSNFGYNETMAQEHFPLSKEEAVKAGYRWWDKIQKTTGKETVHLDNVPDSIADVLDSILNEVLACQDCERNYKIIENELIFYKKHSIPIPRKCFYCRAGERFKMENPFNLWDRNCMCDKNNHGHESQCLNEFKTVYAPERPEIIYCEKCYQSEMY